MDKNNIGVHFTNLPVPTTEHYRLLRLCRPGTIKTLIWPAGGTDTLATHHILREEHPDATIIARLFADMTGGPWTADEFVERFAPQVNATAGLVDYYEVHNEPNLDPALAGYSEGWGPTRDDFVAFAAWARDVLAGLRAACPHARFMFPGNAIPHNYIRFWEVCKDTIREFDAWGVHCYWQYDHHLDPYWGACYQMAHAMAPEMPLYVTEFGDSTPGRGITGKLQRYIEWYGALPAYVRGSACFILGGTDDFAGFNLTEDACRVIGELPREAPFSVPHTAITRYADLIVAAGERYSIDPRVIAAVIWLESRGDPNAVSSAGAVGLMQVVPMLGRPSKQELLDPATNIEWGCKILGGNLYHFEDDLRAALCAYYEGVAGFEKKGFEHPDSIVYLSAFRQGWETLWYPEPLPWEEDNMSDRVADALDRITEGIDRITESINRIADAIESGVVPPPPTEPGEPPPQAKPELWDPYLDQIGVTVERRDGDYELYAGWHTENGSWDNVPDWARQWQQDTLGGDHHAFGRCEGADGSAASNTFALVWPGGGDQRSPEPDGWANIPLAGQNWDPANGPGPYDWFCFGGDKVHGLGMPFNHHHSYFFVWRHK